MSIQTNDTAVIDDSGDFIAINDLEAKTASSSWIATVDEARNGTSSNQILTPLRVRDALQVAGSAPIYAARAWVSFSATTPTAGVPTIIGSGNISSITDLGLGNFRANFTTPMPVNSYVVVGSTDQKTVSSLMICIGPTANTFSTNSFEFRAKGRIFSGSSDWIDPIHASLTVFS